MNAAFVECPRGHWWPTLEGHDLRAPLPPPSFIRSPAECRRSISDPSRAPRAAGRGYRLRGRRRGGRGSPGERGGTGTGYGNDSRGPGRGCRRRAACLDVVDVLASRAGPGLVDGAGRHLELPLLLVRTHLEKTQRGAVLGLGVAPAAEAVELVFHDLVRATGASVIRRQARAFRHRRLTRGLGEREHDLALVRQLPRAPWRTWRRATSLAGTH